jgi:hypothetical protein
MRAVVVGESTTQLLTCSGILYKQAAQRISAAAQRITTKKPLC